MSLNNVVQTDFFNIKNPYGGRVNRLQIQLINQVLATEFLGRNLRATIKSNHFIQVAKADFKREADVKQPTYRPSLSKGQMLMSSTDVEDEAP